MSTPIVSGGLGAEARRDEDRDRRDGVVWRDADVAGGVRVVLGRGRRLVARRPLHRHGAARSEREREVDESDDGLHRRLLQRRVLQRERRERGIDVLAVGVRLDRIGNECVVAAAAVVRFLARRRF
jgi:hypothetical protein